MTTFSSLAAPEVIKMTTSGAAKYHQSDDLSVSVYLLPTTDRFCVNRRILVWGECFYRDERGSGRLEH